MKKLIASIAVLFSLCILFYIIGFVLFPDQNNSCLPANSENSQSCDNADLQISDVNLHFFNFYHDCERQYLFGENSFPPASKKIALNLLTAFSTKIKFINSKFDLPPPGS